MIFIITQTNIRLIVLCLREIIFFVTCCHEFCKATAFHHIILCSPNTLHRVASYLCLLPELPEGQDTTIQKEVLLELLVRPVWRPPPLIQSLLYVGVCETLVELMTALMR